MRFHNIVYLCRQGSRNLLKNKLMSAASIGVLIACFLLIGSAVIFILDVNRIAGYIGDQNMLAVFLNEELTGEDIEIIDKEINAIEGILEISFFSKEDNLKKLSDRLGQSPDYLLADPGNNPLFSSYEVRVGEPERFEEIVTLLEGIDGVDSVEGSGEVAKTLSAIKQSVLYIGVTIVSILVIVSVVIITNTIKITIFSRRKEINIMKYVGATDMFIRLPFLVEGLLIGILAAVIAFLFLGLGYTYLINWLTENYSSDILVSIFTDHAVVFKEIALEILGGFSLLGCLLGMLGSSFFVRKHLRV